MAGSYSCTGWFGGADRSYGIEVGRLAGLPEDVLQRARSLLALFEGEQIVSALSRREERNPEGASTKRREQTTSQDQLALFGPMPHPIIDELKHLDPNEMTPMDALRLLNRLVDRAKQG